MRVCAWTRSTHLTRRAEVVVGAGLAFEAISDNRGHVASITRHAMVHHFRGHMIVVVVIVVIVVVFVTINIIYVVVGVVVIVVGVVVAGVRCRLRCRVG